jgi:hypothetical protein
VVDRSGPSGPNVLCGCRMLDGLTGTADDSGVPLLLELGQTVDREVI